MKSVEIKWEDKIISPGRKVKAAIREERKFSNDSANFFLIPYEPEVDQPQPAFLITVNGDHTLNSDQIAYDGFRIILKRIKNENMMPNHEVSLQKNGLSVAVELPGLYINDESGEIENGSVIVDIEYIDSQGSVLMIKGRKPRLYYIFNDVSSPPKKIVLENNSNSDLLQFLSNNLTKERHSGDFDIAITLPVHVADGKNDMMIFMQDGIYWIFLPYKAKPQETNVVIHNKLT